MAIIKPFRGIRYNQEKINKLSDVVTPPYDVISEEEQKAYYERHPNNVIRLDKNMPHDSDTDSDNTYTRAAGHFNEWLENKILIEDQEPSLYVTAVEFELDGQKITRFGLIAAVRLEPFKAGVVLPHEETFSKVKSERLELMKACHANFSHIWSVYSDQDNVLHVLKSAIAGQTPEEDFIDDAGHHHLVWRIIDPQVQEQVRNGFDQRRLFIADGHHRYETALNYREWVKENTPDFDENHPANYIMMYLCAVEDQGLVILPTHRLIPDVSDADRKQLLEKAAEFFDIETIDVPEDDPDHARKALSGSMTAHRKDHVIGLVMNNSPVYYVLVLKKGVMEQLFGNEIAKPLLGLDVTVLTNLILIRIMGYDKDSMNRESLIGFTSQDKEAVETVRRGDHDIAFILNPPTNDQVCQIAEAGYTMPRKTTFYYPKVITGQVMNKLTR